jgi:endonuclease/exonuclease/phosphatase (EEP) superfamily protein YafD
MRYWLPALLVAGLVAVAGYALVQPLQTTSQALTTSTTTMSTQNQATETVHQTADKPLRLNIAMDGVEFTPGSTIHLTASIQNTGTEEVSLEYFIGQLFEVIIRDGSGAPVYIHSDTGFQKYLMAAPLHLRLAPGESHTETIEITLVYSRGAEKNNPLPPGTYTLTVYLTAAVQGHPSGIIDGVKAYTSASTTLTVRPR